MPLFIEELTKAVLEASADHDTTVLPLGVPGTLQSSLMARLDRIPAAREVAQIGAVIGREFSHALLAAAALLPEPQLARGLNALVASRLTVRRGVPPDATYIFNHALTRDVAYMSLLKRRRQVCHQRIATALEQFDNGLIRATDPQLLAHHFQEAGEVSAAFAYWIAAGDIAEQQGASQEAVAHYRSARQLTQRTDIPAADRTRLPELLMKLGNAQTQKAGYHSEDVLRFYQDAREAAVVLDQQDEAAEAGIRMAPFLFGSCRYCDVMEIGNTILRGNQDRLRPETLVHVWVMLAGASCHMGEFEQSLACSSRAIELDDDVNCTHRAPWAAADPAIVSRDYVGNVRSADGPFRAIIVCSRAKHGDRPGSGALVLHCVGQRVPHFRPAQLSAATPRRLPVPIMLSRFARSMDLTRESATFLLHRGPVLFEWVIKSGVWQTCNEGVALWRKTSGLFMLARNMMMLADYQIRAQQPGRACISLGEAERLAEATEEKDHLAEIIRLRGRIWQSEGNHEAARQCFEQAIARSRAQRARLFELHAARDLVSLAVDAGRRAEAHEKLRSIVDMVSARPRHSCPQPNAGLYCNSSDALISLEVFAMFPVGDVGLKPCQFMTTDRDVVVDELIPQCSAEHCRCGQGIHRFPQACWHQWPLRLCVRVGQRAARIDRVRNAVQTGDDLRAHVEIRIGGRLTEAVLDMRGWFTHASNQPAHRALVVVGPQHPVGRQGIRVQALVASDCRIGESGTRARVLQQSADEVHPDTGHQGAGFGKGVLPARDVTKRLMQMPATRKYVR